MQLYIPDIPQTQAYYYLIYLYIHRYINIYRAVVEFRISVFESMELSKIQAYSRAVLSACSSRSTTIQIFLDVCIYIYIFILNYVSTLSSYIICPRMCNLKQSFLNSNQLFKFKNSNLLSFSVECLQQPIHHLVLAHTLNTTQHTVILISQIERKNILDAHIYILAMHISRRIASTCFVSTDQSYLVPHEQQSRFSCNIIFKQPLQEGGLSGVVVKHRRAGHQLRPNRRSPICLNGKNDI